MGKTMDKKSIIWGEAHSVSLASFSSGHMTNIVDVIQQKIGPKAAINHAAAQSAVLKAKANPKMKNGYVKVGLIGSDLVLRCKEKKFLGDIEVDAILVKGYPAKVNAWKIEKTKLDMEALEKAAELRQKQRLEDERARRLHTVMNTPNEEGDTMRTKILRAAQNAQKLGVGDYAKGKLKAQGLTAMDERYHGEAIDPKNRYGRYMPELRALWEQHASQLKSYGKWLDDAEAGRIGVAGVSEALALRKPKNEGGGPIISQGEVAGGRVLYLDADARQAYVATVKKGVVSGGKPAGNNTIFVIGPDNKIYIGGKARGGGKVNAFNHSSFFAGGPVKSAGSLKLSGSRITEISDVSGHYTPNKAMVLQAVRKFAGGDQDWLAEVDVKLGSAGTIKGKAFLVDDHAEQTTQIWSKYSAGALSPANAAKVLLAAADGNWLVRQGSDDKLQISYRSGEKVAHDLATSIGGKGLDRKKLLLPARVTELLQSLPKTTTTRSPKPSQEREQREKESQETPSTPGRRTTVSRPSSEQEQPEKESQEKPVVKRSRSKWVATPEIVEAAHNSPGWHGVMNSERAVEVLGDKPKGWLLRENKDQFVTLSVVLAPKNYRHMLINSETNYRSMLEYIQANASAVVRPS